MAKVRPITLDDLELVLTFARALHSESVRYRDRNFNEGKVNALTMHVAAHGGGFIVERDDGVPVGIMAGLVIEQFFGTDLFATDLVTFILPSARGSSIFPRLIKAFEEWAISKGVVEILPGISAELDSERLVELYEHMGYSLSSYGMLKKVDHV